MPVLIFLVALVAALLIIFRPIRGPKGDILRNVLVIDGDTVYAEGRKYRLHGIDAPEMDQAGGPEARDALKRFVQWREIRAEQTDTDPYGRIVARLHAGHGDICEAMVLSGYARASFHRDYERAERRARREKMGLWASGGISDPAAHRRARRSR